eukprot:scaffold14306_cov80-Isochrysis_galbana.AAC.2
MDVLRDARRRQHPSMEVGGAGTPLRSAFCLVTRKPFAPPDPQTPEPNVPLRFSLLLRPEFPHTHTAGGAKDPPPSPLLRSKSSDPQTFPSPQVELRIQPSPLPRSKSSDTQTFPSPQVELRALVAALSVFRSSCLIMDEVDMLLHPLKSELNFPCASGMGAQE